MTEPASSQTPRAAVPHWLAVVLLVLAAAFWAGSSVAGRAAAGDVPPMTLSFLRWSLAFVLLLPLGARPAWRERRIIARNWPIMCAFAFFGIVGFTVPYFVGLQFTEAVNVSILNASAPIMTILLSFAMLGVVVSRGQAWGIVFALFGTFAIVGRGSIEALLGFVLNIGDMLALSAFLSWSIYTVMLRWRPAGISSYSFLITIVGLACLMIAPLYVMELVNGRSFVLSTGNLAIIGYAALFPSCLAYLCWIVAVPVVGANLAAIIQYLNPVFGIIFAMIILGENVEAFHVVGIAAIFAGIYLSRSRRANESAT